MPAISTGLAIGLGALSAGSNIAGSAIGARGAKKAARVQAAAAERSAELQRQAGIEAREGYGPYTEFGEAGTGEVSRLLGLGGDPESEGYGSLMEGFGQEFAAPTREQMEAEPGFQFRLQQGIDALQNSAAARGGLLTGATAEALSRYGQDYASGEYQNVYNRALGEYQQAYNMYQQNQANQYGRLMGASGVGQQATRDVGNILTGTARGVGTAGQQAGLARASGYGGAAGAWQGGLRGITGDIMNLGYLSQLGRGRRQGGYPEHPGAYLGALGRGPAPGFNPGAAYPEPVGGWSPGPVPLTVGPDYLVHPKRLPRRGEERYGPNPVLGGTGI
jgi:hypothetical protein